MQKETKDSRLELTGSTNRNYAVDMRSEAQVLHLVIAIVVVMWVLEAPQFKYINLYTVSRMLGRVYLFSVLV